jgi:hypothetical protein
MCTCHACACHVCAGSYVCIPCVCMLMYVYAIYVRTHVCVCHVLTWRPGPSMGLLYQASLYSWSQDSLNLGVLSCLHPATARVLQGALWPCLTFYVGSEDLNSRPRASTASAFIDWPGWPMLSWSLTHPRSTTKKWYFWDIHGKKTKQNNKAGLKQ